MTKAPYYAKNGAVWKKPIETLHPDGGRSISMGFPICTMHEAVGDDAAKDVAALMNAGHLSAYVNEVVVEFPI